MDLVACYPGVRDFIGAARADRTTFSLSATRHEHPILGPKHDLHGAARGFLDLQKLVGADNGVPAENIFFELTKEEKVARAAALGVDVFIDDLPEILAMPGWPPHNASDPVRSRGPLADGEVERAPFRAPWNLGRTISRVRPARPGRFDERRGRQPCRLAARLASEIGRAPPSALVALTGGKNNRVFRVEMPDGPSADAQILFFGPARSPRSSCRGMEFFAPMRRPAAVTNVPEPLARDTDAHCGLYSFLSGRKLLAEEIKARHVEAAADFILKINSLPRNPVSLLPGSEACFSLRQHMETVDRRVARLGQLDPRCAASCGGRASYRGTTRPRLEGYAETNRVRGGESRGAACCGIIASMKTDRLTVRLRLPQRAGGRWWRLCPFWISNIPAWTTRRSLFATFSASRKRPFRFPIFRDFGIARWQAFSFQTAPNFAVVFSCAPIR